MNHFLQTCKSSLGKLVNYKRIFVVLGNESCDLDSVVSPLIYAYFLHKQHDCVIPVLNIHEDEFPLRTESKYFLDKLKINIHNLIFRNNIDLSQLSKENKLKLVLVDHHVLPMQDQILENSVFEIIDHRPLDKNSKWLNIEVTIRTVGSCATLVANKILNNKNIDCIDEVVAKLLHGTIILDTINFNTDANRFTELDVETANLLEKQFKINYSREQIYKELVTARSDVSTLTAFQILHRDMKIISNVPFPGCPMLIQNYLEISGAKIALEDFCKSKKCEVMVLMGLATINNIVYRDIGVYSINNCVLKTELLQKLTDTTELNLKEVNTDITELTLYSQGNVKMSRKHIVPILKPVIDNIKGNN